MTSTRGFVNVAERLRDLSEDIPEAIDDEMEDVTDDVVRQARTEMSVENMHYRGHLWSSMYTTSKQLGDGRMQYTAGSNSSVAPHNRFVEFGTGDNFSATGFGLSDSDVGGPYSAPSFSPQLVEAIETWMEEKPVPPREYPTIEGAARAAAHHISTEGTERQPYFRPAWYRVKQAIPTRLRKSIAVEFKKAGFS